MGCPISGRKATCPYIKYFYFGKVVIGWQAIAPPLPTSSRDIEEFLRVNSRVFNEKQKQIIKKLDLEAAQNWKLKIEISSNS
jgi:hypothetical protein